MSPRVLITMVTHNSAPHLEHCLASLKASIFRDTAVAIWDNASTDGTVDILAKTGQASVSYCNRNVGFCAAHNRLIDSCDSEFVLVLNPDVFLDPEFVDKMAQALDSHPEAGCATGKLWRWQSENPASAGETRVLDTTGIYFTPAQRHLDRGSGEPDSGQYGKSEYVFGASGAAAFFRRKMLEELRVDGEYFDEAFFAYREDADLAWRAQWLGWRCLYVPEATGFHVRRVLPERRSILPAGINMHSFKNRFLLRVKNMDAGTYARFFLPITARDLAALVYVLVRERTSLKAFPLFFQALPRTLQARRALRRHRRAKPKDLRAWFSYRPTSRPLENQGRTPR
jgi:GT2 family glycosyltransferase